jgi:hypothetical protein
MEKIFRGTVLFLSTRPDLTSEMSRVLGITSVIDFHSASCQRPITFVVTFILHYKFAKQLTHNITNSNVIHCVLKCCIQFD